MDHPYSVPVISTELRRAEFVKQLADVFDHMDQISQDMFNRITIRLNMYRQQLNKFDEKINNVNLHIERIRQFKRATQIHSSSRYPVEQKRSIYKSIFEDNDRNTNNYENYLTLQWNSFRLSDDDKFYDVNDKDSKAKDETFVISINNDNYIQKTKTNKLHGLGKPSANIKSVVSFLKYNTQENPYTQPTKIDPLSVAGKMRKHTEEQTQSRIGETPLPAFYQSMSALSGLSEIEYNPVLGAVPTLSLPDNLELPNFATDLYQEWTMESIAPSSANLLPDIKDLTSNSVITTATQAPPPSIVSDVPAIIPLVQSTISTIPPPPPPSLPTESLQKSVLAPQAPLPPPTTVDNNTNELEVESKVNQTQSIPTATSTGNPLLDAIQNFKKDNLRSAQDKKMSKRAEEEAKDAPDLLKNLQKQLEKRRYFVAGGPDESKRQEKKTATMADEIAGKLALLRQGMKKNNDDDDNNDDADDEADWEQ
ncbi:unnamed protein product [Didymodactylos carnosus]|uniref:WASH1 WAHD domain-containing protein n=1 Tax=Didymodactylos carnosus TaxID=1234261 RepID=A0A814J8G4_9BILA|nr:unnamed protein product [Didymodactylos carnosus]CAF1034707.1 unnamed protein product [Didymodactylos carnosus]CAF3791031.1 unnamed protein product [Didymodactylos carnosus]CAF3805385.1 unnamed protein product [Didymodactylos carnosus]